MDHTQQDIRITKTHKALVETMQKLLERKSFQRITVNDICQNAMVSRSTFYLHFDDKYQLLMFFLQDERKQLEKAMHENDAKETIGGAFSIIKARKNTYRNILDSENNSELYQMFLKFFSEFISDTLIANEKQGIELVGPLPILSAYYANAIAGTMLWWINDNSTVSVDEVALCLYNLLSDIIPE